jgi:hypothetical protein
MISVGAIAFILRELVTLCQTKIRLSGPGFRLAAASRGFTRAWRPPGALSIPLQRYTFE